MRTPANKQNRNANKKLFIEPGISVSVNDILLDKKAKKRKASNTMVTKVKKPNLRKERTIAEEIQLHQDVEDTSTAIGDCTFNNGLSNIRQDSSCDSDEND